MKNYKDRDGLGLAPGVEKQRDRFFARSPLPVRVEFGARSHPGKEQTVNEDQFLIVRRRRTRDVLLTSLPKGWLPSTEEYAYVSVVADGVGGAAFGDVASLLALRTGFNLGFSEIHWPLKVSEEEVQELMEKFETYGELIHRSLLRRAQEQPELCGMGTTMTAAYTIGLDAFIGHVGDSRAYIHHDKSLKQVTRDQTLAQQLIDRGVLSATSLEVRRFRHVLLNCLGAGQQPVAVEVGHHRLFYGDSLLLCTDGLTDLVNDKQIAEILNDHPTPSDACNVLLDLAMEKGGHDNITVVIAKYEMPEPTHEDRESAIAELSA